MLKIGEFSKVTRVTVKALRHYDETGLLKPSQVDAFTGYRYYSYAQLPRLYRIITLKNAGFSLAEIRSLVEIEPQAADFRQMMQRKQAELQSELTAVQSKLTQVAAFLSILDLEERYMDYSVIVKELPAVTVASLRTVIPNYQAYHSLYPEMGAYMAEQGCLCAEPEYCFTIYRDGEYRDHDIDVEICQAVVEAKSDSSRVQFKQVSAVPTAACVLHRGPYETIGLAYGALGQWTDQNGWQIVGPPRESYIDGIWNKENPHEWLTEVQIPVQRSSE